MSWNVAKLCTMIAEKHIYKQAQTSKWKKKWKLKKKEKKNYVKSSTHYFRWPLGLLSVCRLRCSRERRKTKCHLLNKKQNNWNLLILNFQLIIYWGQEIRMMQNETRMINYWGQDILRTFSSNLFCLETAKIVLVMYLQLMI